MKLFFGSVLGGILGAILITSNISYSTLYKWSQTAGLNNNSDATINWNEGQAPSTVNDSARAMMAAMAKYRDDISGRLVTGGTGTAYTLTTNQVFNSAVNMDGAEVCFRVHATSGASPNLNVDGLGARNITQTTGAFIATGALINGGIYCATYNNSVNEWLVKGIAGQIPSGTQMLTTSSACPLGWTISAANNDKTLIISSSSGGVAGGSVSYGTAFSGAATVGGTAISQAQLPSYSLSAAGLTWTGQLDSPIVGFNTNIGTTNTFRASDGTGGQVTQQPTVSGSVGGSISSGGSNQTHTHTIPAVQFVTAIACTKN